MIYSQILTREKKVIAWYRDIEPPAGLQYTAKAGERSAVVFDVLEDVEQADCRYAGRREADIVKATAYHLLQTTPMGNQRAIDVRFDGDDLEACIPQT